MLTSKERAAKRAAANGMPVIMQVGKNGIEKNSVIQVDDALTARELIKLRVLDTSESTPREIANALAEKTGAEVVQVVGSVIVLWRERPKDRQ